MSYFGVTLFGLNVLNFKISDTTSIYIYRQGLNNRIPAPNDQLQVRVDVLQGDVDEEIGELHSRVRKLKGVSIKRVLLLVKKIKRL